MINMQLNKSSKHQSDKIEQSSKSKSEIKYDNDDIGISKESSTIGD